MDKKYDKKNKKSILEYAMKAKNHKISEIISESSVLNKKDKGAIGNLIQEDYFDISRNSKTEPDFEEAGLELKTFGYWNDGKKSRADQRLALAAIDYMDYVEKVDFKKSHLYHKCRSMLFMAYLLELDKNRLDSDIKYVRLYEFDKIFEEDLNQIIDDYNLITEKIKDGMADKLSEGDTEFLGAARTGSKESKEKDAPMGVKALPRRFAFKQSYMSYLVREYLVKEKDFGVATVDKKRKTPQTSFDQILKKVDEKYVGKTAREILSDKKVEEIVGKLDLSMKNAYSRLGKAMLGMKSNQDDYLLKTNTVVKSVRINQDGVTMEPNPFPNFEISNVVESEWEDSQMYSYLSERRFILQIFVDNGNEYIYTGQTFMKFTPEQLDKYVKDTWLDFKEKINNGLKFTLKLNKNGNCIIYNNVNGITNNQIGVIKLHVKDVVYDIDIANISGLTKEAEEFIRKHTVNNRFRWKIYNKDKYGDKLPNGDIIPKQSFWLNKSAILLYLKENAPELLKI